MALPDTPFGSSNAFAQESNGAPAQGTASPVVSSTSIDFEVASVSPSSEATAVTVAAPLPVYNNDQIASYIQSGYFGVDY